MDFKIFQIDKVQADKNNWLNIIKVGKQDICKEFVEKETASGDIGKRQWRFKVMGTAAVIASCVWWFILYPDLCFPQDTYEVVCDAEAEMPAPLLDADTQDGQIVITGRLWEWLQQLGKEK